MDTLGGLVDKQGNDNSRDMDRLPGRALMICVTIFRLSSNEVGK